MITKEVIETTTIELLKRAETRLPSDIVSALEKAYDIETDDLPKTQLKNILENIKLAKESTIPMCQDTGIQIFFVHLPKNPELVSYKDIEEGILSGVIQATSKVPLRPNTVHPLTRANPGDNTGVHMPYINYTPSNNEYLGLTVMPKGAGSENMSAIGMLTPAQGIKGIKEFVMNTLVHAGGKPCPPIILGVGIGGSADISIKLAKEALLRPIDQHHADPQIAALEQELYDALNGIGIGPMGLGGKTTLLGINIEYAHCHTASHPVAVNIQCWAARRARAKIFPDNIIEFGD